MCHTHIFHFFFLHPWSDNQIIGYCPEAAYILTWPTFASTQHGWPDIPLSIPPTKKNPPLYSPSRPPWVWLEWSHYLFLASTHILGQSPCEQKLFPPSPHSSIGLSYGMPTQFLVWAEGRALVQLQDVTWAIGLTACALWPYLGLISDATFLSYNVLILVPAISMTVCAWQNLGQNGWAFNTST